MIDPTTMASMLAERLAANDQTTAIVEALLLRKAFDRLDDFLCWLDQHVATDHGEDASSTAVLQMIGGVRLRITREIALVDAAMEKIAQ